MTRTYCTLFDKNYLYQGLALYQSLVRHADDFKLYVLCMDSVSYMLLTSMALPNLIALSLSEIMTPEVERVRERTTHGQFCWVSQPLICQYILKHFNVDMVTYLESDSLFFSSPEPIFEELGSSSVSLVPHNFSKGHEYEASFGEFCVQFNAFKNDDAAHEVLAYWKECCFRYDKSAPRAYPGQTTLDSWPQRFPCVAVIRHVGAGVAPWNICGYRLEQRGLIPYVDGAPTVFFHYHQYGRVKGGAHELGAYPMTDSIIDAFYRPYVNEIRLAEHAVLQVDPAFCFRKEYVDSRTLLQLLARPSFENALSYFRVVRRKYRGTYNVHPDSYFAESSSAGSL